MPKPIGSSNRYMPGIDGLRAIAVLAVIAYHLNIKWVPGGLLGVTLFFVLSGYLITDILLKQLNQNKKLNLKTFLIRRARRLLPAMFIMLAAVSLWLAMSDANRLLSLKGDIGSALLYINNWWLIFHEVSYFESFGPASPFGHLWSLAVEEQFYLVWPLLLVAVIRFVPKRGKLALWTLAAAALSAGAMILLYQPDADPSRVYYGTDTRAFSLLIGAALAIVWPSRKLSEAISSRSRMLLDTAGTAGLVIVLLMIGKVGEYDSFLYRGGMVLFSVATAVVVAALAHPASKLARLVGSKALTWIGVRSYGIYLYHYPIIVLTTPAAESGELHPLRAMTQVVLTLILAELSWRFIEEPIRHGALERLASLLKQQAVRRIPFGRIKRSAGYFTASVLVITTVSCMSSADLQSASMNLKNLHSQIVNANNEEETPAPDHVKQDELVVEATPHPETTPEPLEPQKQENSKPTRPVKNENLPPAVDHAVVEQPAPTASPVPNTGSVPSEGSVNPAPEQEPAGSDKEPVEITAIGDSVLLDAGPYLEKWFPGIVIDGKIGRQFRQAAAIVESMKSSNQLGDTVIIELGTNGIFTAKQMSELLETIGSERHILLINTRVPRKWQDSVNEMLAETADSNENVTLVDWYAASKDKEDFFSADGVHLNKEGAEFYADLLARAINGKIAEEE